MRSSGSFHLHILVISRKVVGGIGLHGNELINARVADSRAVKGYAQGLPAGVGVGGIEFQLDALLALMLPVKARV